jgi:hypothetical protein
MELRRVDGDVLKSWIGIAVRHVMLEEEAVEGAERGYNSSY